MTVVVIYNVTFNIMTKVPEQNGQAGDFRVYTDATSNDTADLNFKCRC